MLWPKTCVTILKWFKTSHISMLCHFLWRCHLELLLFSTKSGMLRIFWWTNISTCKTHVYRQIFQASLYTLTPWRFLGQAMVCSVLPNFFNSICPSMLHLFLYCSVLQHYSITLLQCSTSRVLLLCEELHQYNGSITHSLNSSLFVIKILIQPVQASAILITSSLAETFSSSPPTEATSMKWCCSCWC